MKIKISRDILAGYVIVLMMMVGWFLYFSQTNTSKYESLYVGVSSIMESEAKVRDLQVGKFSDLRTAHNNFFYNPRQSLARTLVQKIRDFNVVLAREKHILVQLNREWAATLDEHINEYSEPLNSLAEMSGDSAVRAWMGRNPNFFENQNNRLAQINFELESFRSLLSQQLIDNINTMPQIVSGNFVLFSLLFLAVIAISALFGILFSRKVSEIIVNISDELNSASEDILTAANNGEQSMKLQSDSIDKTAETLHELSTFADEVANNAQNVSEQVETTAKQVSELTLKAGEIGKITTTIEEISHQINILSLNASIEASRAGEQGKGFSAVALEIRKMAENTRGFTENISNIIKEIQHYTTKSSELTGHAVESVHSITENVHKQNTATSDISTAVSSINTTMKRNVENIRGTVEASENVHELAQQLKALT